MANNRFVIERKDDKKIETFSVRVSKDFLDELDATVAKTGLSRNEFVIRCIKYALKYLDITEGK